LPRALSGLELTLSLIVLLSTLAFIFYSRGGKIQGVVLRKTNTTDVRSASIIDATYGFVLLYFTYVNTVPMSTTWVFIGLLAGRELSLKWRFQGKLKLKELKDVGLDLTKVTLGLLISIGLVYFVKIFTG
jgi:hypothetical protein